MASQRDLLKPQDFLAQLIICYNQWEQSGGQMRAEARNILMKLLFGTIPPKWKPLSFAVMLLPPDPINIARFSGDAEMCDFLPTAQRALGCCCQRLETCFDIAVPALQSPSCSFQLGVNRAPNAISFFHGNTVLKPFFLLRKERKTSHSKDIWGKMQLRGVCFREIQRKKESPGCLPKEVVAPTRVPGTGSEQALSTPKRWKASPSTPTSSATSLLCNPDGFCLNLYYDGILASPLFLFYLIYPRQCCSFDSETNCFIILAFHFFPSK